MRHAQPGDIDYIDDTDHAFEAYLDAMGRPTADTNTADTYAADRAALEACIEGRAEYLPIRPDNGRHSHGDARPFDRATSAHDENMGAGSLTMNAIESAILSLNDRREQMRADLLTTRMPRESAWYQARVKAVHELTAQIRDHEDRLYRLHNA